MGPTGTALTSVGSGTAMNNPGGTSTQFPAKVQSFHIGTSPTSAKYFLLCDTSGSGDAKLFSYRVTEHGAGEASGDFKGYAGTMCNSSSFDGHIEGGTSIQWMIHEPDASLENIDIHLLDHSVWCPIIGDHYLNTAGLNTVKVYFREGGNTDRTSCRIKYWTDSGAAAYQTSATQTAAAGGGEQTFTFIGLPAGANGTRYELDCSLSRSSTIHGYEVTEN
jgi:hypothetical protein